MQLTGKAKVCFHLLAKYLEIRNQEDTTEIRHLDFLLLIIVKTDTSHLKKQSVFFWRRYLAAIFDEH